jgi:D-xylose transport system permease protein
MILALAAVWIGFQMTTNGIFLEPRNLSNLIRQTAVTGVLAVGMVLVIIAAEIDLSVGSLVGLTGMLAAITQTKGSGLAVVILVALASGLLLGALQGALVAYGEIPSFIVTLGGLLAWRGVTKGISAGNTIPVTIDAFRKAGQGYLTPTMGYILALVAIAGIIWSRRRGSGAAGSTVARAASVVVPSAAILAAVIVLNQYVGVPIPAVIFLAFAMAGAFVAEHTVFGRYLYAVGGNPDAARLSGINLRRHRLAAFAIMGLLAGVAGIIYTARVGGASPDAGTLLELDAIAACVIGGASLMGGRGTVFGAFVGALFMASLDNGMSLKNVPDFVQDIVKGGVLVTAVGLDAFGRRRS